MLRHQDRYVFTPLSQKEAAPHEFWAQALGALIG